MTAARGSSVPDSSAPWLRIGNGSLSVEVLARPGAPRTAILRAEPRGVVIAIAAPAEKGKANDELRRFIAKLARVTRASVEIVKGESSRAKIVGIVAADPSAIAKKIAAAVPHG